jgi:Putative zinc-finger
MSEHVTELLGAYLDGELESGLEEQVRSHLVVCLECRQELAAVQSLSDWLRSDPIPVTDPAVFVDRLEPQLPARPDKSSPGLNLQTIWWLVPLVALILGFVSRLVINLAGLLFFTGQSGILGDTIRNLVTEGWLLFDAPSLITILSSLLDVNFSAILPGVESFWQIAVALIEELAWLGALLLVCGAWLVTVWNRHVIQNKRVLLQD